MTDDCVRAGGCGGIDSAVSFVELSVFFVILVQMFPSFKIQVFWRWREGFVFFRMCVFLRNTVSPR